MKWISCDVNCVVLISRCDGGGVLLEKLVDETGVDLERLGEDARIEACDLDAVGSGQL